MTDIVKKAEELLEGIAPEWAYSYEGSGTHSIFDNGVRIAVFESGWGMAGAESQQYFAQQTKNAELTAASPTLVRGLLDRVKELEKELKIQDDANDIMTAKTEGVGRMIEYVSELEAALGEAEGALEFYAEAKHFEDINGIECMETGRLAHNALQKIRTMTKQEGEG
jgi:hypothetical protein